MMAVCITVYGKVQGVFFRKFTQQVALSLELSGFVRNNSNGSVYIEAKGADEKIEKLIEWCRKGPVASKVEKIESSEIEPGFYRGFEIRRTE
jgi:acylphosphatase